MSAAHWAPEVLSWKLCTAPCGPACNESADQTVDCGTNRQSGRGGQSCGVQNSSFLGQTTQAVLPEHRTRAPRNVRPSTKSVSGKNSVEVDQVSSQSSRLGTAWGRPPDCCPVAGFAQQSLLSYKVYGSSRDWLSGPHWASRMTRDLSSEQATVHCLVHGPSR